MEKSPDAFRTISEVADELGLPQHVLRFWETRFSQIKPMKRTGGRRYYRPDDVELVRAKGERIGRNPKTGVEASISPRRVVVFKASHVLKARINGQSVDGLADD